VRLLHGDQFYCAIRDNASDRVGGIVQKSKQGCSRKRKQGYIPSLEEMFEQRCGTCKLCCLVDCGKCSPCKDNQAGTSTKRQVCLLKQCMSIHKVYREAKHGWFFAVSYTIPRKENVRPALRGLPSVYWRLCLTHQSDKDKTFDILTAAQKGEYDNKILELTAFLEEMFGCELVESVGHKLVKKGYYMSCLSIDGNIKEFVGKISSCQKHVIYGWRQFSIQFDDVKVGTLNGVSEEMAWGGFSDYTLWKKEDNFVPESNAKFQIKWIATCITYCKKEPCHCSVFHLEYKGVKLKFEVKESNIPKAGDGLFVSCIGSNELVLECGEMLDLGVYAPLHQHEIKSWHICLVKNLLFDWKIETWAFTAHKDTPEKFRYDPTEDATGILNADTQRRGICFANEINNVKSQTASITPQYDPEGMMHYLLGHGGKNDTCLTIPSEEHPIELLVRI
jgi:hypothetical protein